MPRVVRELAAELLPETPELARGVTEHLFATIAELGSQEDPDLWEEAVTSAQSNFSQALGLMSLGAGLDGLAAPAENAELVRGLVRRGITVAALLRMFRLGHGWFWDRWSRSLNDRVVDGGELVAARDESSAFIFAYVDLICDILVLQYETERVRMVRTAAHVRAETVRAILAGEAVDGEVAARRLGYELRRYHVAMRLSGARSELHGLERAASEAASVVGPGEPLIVPSGAATLDVWSGSHEPADIEALTDYEPPDGIRIVLGEPGYGTTGFRESHQQAVQAARVTALAREGADGVTCYRTVELVSLLASDLPRARAFVAARLGPLASNSEPVAQLRDTVLAFLAANGSSSRAAKELYVHPNTVAYRVKRAEALLGRRVIEDTVELVCALTLAAGLGDAVLPTDDIASNTLDRD